MRWHEPRKGIVLTIDDLAFESIDVLALPDFDCETDTWLDDVVIPKYTDEFGDRFQISS